MSLSMRSMTDDGKSTGGWISHIITLSNGRAVDKFVEAVAKGKEWENVLEDCDTLVYDDSLDGE